MSMDFQIKTLKDLPFLERLMLRWTTKREMKKEPREVLEYFVSLPVKSRENRVIQLIAQDILNQTP